MRASVQAARAETGQASGTGVVSRFRDLQVWQQGMHLVESVYRATTGFPVEERYALAHQMRRAATSIPAKIAEAHTTGSTRAYLQHLSVAQASLAELETEFEIAKRLHYISVSQLAPIVKSMASLGRQLHAVRDAMKERA